MNTNLICLRVYRTASVIVATVLLLLCLEYRWPLGMIAMAMAFSILISMPALISLQMLIWMFRKTGWDMSFIWMLLLSSIPVLSLLAAWLFADFVPGKIGFVLLLGMLGGYCALLGNGISISQFFNSTRYEREENHSID